MADDINLPNLVSHLQVNLGGTSGDIADAARAGSAMGSALGTGIHRELDNLLRHLPQVQIDGDSDPLDRDLARIHRELAQLDAQRIGVDISIPDALRQLEELEVHLQRISDEHPNVNVRAATRQATAQLEALRAAARAVDDEDVHIDVDVDEDRPRRLAGVLGRIGGMAGSIAGVAASFGRVSAMIGSAVPAVASVVTTLANVAPAAGVAVTGMAAVQLASGAVKLAAVGMKDALTAALDPSAAEDYAETLKKLSPEARKFAQAVHEAAPALNRLQQSVQDRVFRGLADQLERTGRSVLPVLRTNLLSSAGAMNDMATGVLMAARYMAKTGTLGQALGSASQGLKNLAGVPAVVVNSLGQIAAAAGPTFERLTAGAGRAAAGIGDKLSAAFESGAMQKAIEHAIDLIGQLARVGGNVFKIIGNIFNAVPAGGGGLIGVLEDVSSALANITSTEGVQQGLAALFQTISTLGSSAAPLLAQALAAVAPVLTALGPPVQTLILALQQGLTPVIDALGPVLQSAASAFGKLIVALAPVLPVLGQMIATLLPALIPLFDALGQIFVALAPVVQVIAETIGMALAPVLSSLPALLQPLLDAFVQIAQTEGPLLVQLLTELQPSFVELGKAFGQIMEALGPLLPQLFLLGAQLFEQIAPYLPPLIDAFAKFATAMTGQVVWAIETFVIPALQLLSLMLSGDTPKATEAAGRAMEGLERIVSAVWNAIVAYIERKIGEALLWIAGMPGRAANALAGLAISLMGQANRAGSAMVNAISEKIGEAVNWVRGLPGRAAASLGNLGGILYSAGASLIQGFIDGISSMIGTVRSKLGQLTSMLPDWKGPKSKDAKILQPAGRLLIEGFIKGIDESTAKLKSRLASITRALPANTKSGIGKTLKRQTEELEKLVARRDGVLKKLEAAQKKLKSLTDARAKAAGDITKGILDEANITRGHADVNSVSAITVGLQQALTKTKEFQANIARLRKAGLRSDLLQQIADAGVEAGGATAAALARATPAELARINSLQSQLAKSASATGNTVGDALYKAGIQAAQGLVNGLKSQQRQIEATMERIAESMLRTVKKTHKTKSPSRAFHEIGVMDMEGWRGGVLATAARAVGAARSVAADMLTAVSGRWQAPIVATPSAGQLAAVAASPSRALEAATNHFHLYGSDATPGGILRALSWQGLVGRR